MSNVESRVEQCFVTVFPDLPLDDVRNAALDDTPQWDSLATVILVTVLEEEFSVSIDPNDFGKLTSYASIVDYLQSRLEDAGIPIGK